MNAFEVFKGRFAFKPELAFHLGVEREFFITDLRGNIVPRAACVLKTLSNPLNGSGSFSYELSACQIETQSVPCYDQSSIRMSQEKLTAALDHALQRVDLKRVSLEVAPEDMPLDVFPDPSGRYHRIAEGMRKDILLAACRVTGTHFHVGMPDHETALRVYNSVIKHSDELCSMGDNSFGKRLAIYKEVASHCDPVPYSSWEEFYKYAAKNGFEQNPRDCWHLIRLTIHGTIEFRHFGATDSIEKIVEWGEYCRKLCLEN